jgi:ABC-type transport system involved in multi-copper enzyme maturation permease subunit
MLPLLVKDLTELAQRRRLFLLRAAVAVVGALVVGTALRVPDYAKGDLGGTFYLLGRGARVLDTLVYTTCMAILLVVPAFAATAFTSEKERGSLPLLLLTRLSPARLVLEKWLGLVAFALSLALVLAPLATVAFALGGIEPERLALAGAVVLLSAGWAAAVGLAWSAWSRTSGGAFLATVGCLGAVLAIAVEFKRPSGRGFSLDWLMPPLIYEAQRPTRWTDCAIGVGAILVVLAQAWFWLPRRVEVAGRPLLKRGFAWLDQRFNAAERRWVGRTVAVDLPGDRPVAWRAARWRSLANPRYLVRLLLPVAVLSLIVGLVHPMWQAALLGAACLLMAAVAAAQVAGERDGETLDVLLTSGISPRSLVLQKMTALRQLHLGLAVVLLLPAMVLWWFGPGAFPHRRSGWEPWVVLVGIVMLPPLAAWGGTLAGLLVARRGRAVAFAALGLAVWWLGLPFLIVVFAVLTDQTNRTSEAVMLVSSPITIQVANGEGVMGSHPFDKWQVAIAGFAVISNLAYLIFLRHLALHLAERCLRRA